MANFDVDATLERLDGLECISSYDVPPRWFPVETEVAREILYGWVMSPACSSAKLEQAVEALAQGHVVVSPLHEAYRFRAGSLAGQQQQLI